MKKTLVISSIIVGIILIGIAITIGGKYFMDEQAKKQAQEAQYEKMLATVKAQVKEEIEWNFKDINSVTFEYQPTPTDGTLPTKQDQSLRTTPMGGLYYDGYINGNKKLQFDAKLNTDFLPNKLSIDDIILITSDRTGLIDTFEWYKAPVLDQEHWPNKNWLTSSDISQLKKQG